MANTNPGDQHDRANYPDSTASQPPNQPGENHVVQPTQGYSSGYNQGRVVERQRYEAVQQTRDENNTANGLLIGILLTGLVLGGAALAYFVTQRDRTPIQRTLVLPSVSPSPSPEVKERVIERDRVVPVPQPQQSAPTIIPAPNIKIETPSSPAPQASPSTPTTQQQEPTRTEQPKSAEPTTQPSPEATTSPSSSSSGQ